MKKFSIVMLISTMILCICSITFAADIKVNGKVEGIWAAGGGVDNTGKKSDNILGNPALFDALLSFNGKVSDSVNAHLNVNLAGANLRSGQELNSPAENYVDVKLGPGTLQAGNILPLGLKVRNTLYTNDVLGFYYNTPVGQVAYSCECAQTGAKIDLAIVPGLADKKAKPTNDVAVKVGTAKPIQGVDAALLYVLDTVTNTDVNGDGANDKNSRLGICAGYTIQGVSIDAQMFSFDKKATTAKALTAKDTSIPTSEVVVGAGYKVKDIDLGASYDMYGKANNIALTAGTEIAKGATLKIRADIAGKDYKNNSLANLGNNVIGVTLGTEF